MSEGETRMPSRYERLVQQAEDHALSKGLATALRAAVAAGDDDLATWVRLELLGYVRENPAMRKQTVVPEYRTVGGQWFDEYGRPLVITDPKLTFVNETRLRMGVVELEAFVGASGVIALRLPEFSDIVRQELGVEVSVFRFSPRAVPQVLANIRAHLLDRLAAHRRQLEPAPVVRSGPREEDIVELRPNFYGIGINLKALWRRLRSKFGQE